MKGTFDLVVIGTGSAASGVASRCRVVATNLIEGNTVTPDYSIVPSVLFTLPPAASVGLGEQAAHERGLTFVTHHENTGGWYSSRRIGEDTSGFKVLVEESSGRVLGTHVLGPMLKKSEQEASTCSRRYDRAHGGIVARRGSSRSCRARRGRSPGNPRTGRPARSLPSRAIASRTIPVARARRRTRGRSAARAR